jgi:CRP/FNR family cyclic AMP-dependent transcriptional regulator
MKFHPIGKPMKIPILSDLLHSAPADISNLVEAIKGNVLDDTLARFVPEAAWPTIAKYLHVENVQRGHILTAKGALDRTLFFVESGRLVVHYEAGDGRQHVVADIGPGSVVGEGAFFTQIERNATVQAKGPCRVWSLTPGAFTRMSKTHTEVALALSIALGATVSMRMLDITKRATVT